MTDIELTADTFKVHAQEKVSTGDYESYSANASLEGSVEGVHKLDNGTQRELKARLLAIHRDLQEVVERTAENRLKAEGYEDWGVPKGEGDDD